MTSFLDVPAGVKACAKARETSRMSAQTAPDFTFVKESVRDQMTALVREKKLSL